MIDLDQALRATLTRHAADAPDAGTPLLAAVHTRSRRARRRRIASLGATAVAVVAVVGVSVPLTAGHGHRAGPVTVKPTPRPASLVPPTITFAPTWLPAGSKEVERAVTYRGGLRSYTLPKKKSYLYINDGPPMFVFGGPGSPVTVGGRQALEWPMIEYWGTYDIQLTLRSGAVVSVGVSGLSASAAQDVGRRVAAGLVDSAPVPLTPEFVMGTAPPGLAIAELSTGVRAGDFCTYLLAQPGVRSAHPSAVQVQVGTAVPNVDIVPALGEAARAPNNNHPTERAVAGRPVQGHETRVAAWPGGVTLWVIGLVNGQTIKIQGGDQVSTPDQLYALADSIRLVR